MKHIILTPINFMDFELMEKYLKFTKEFFIPSLKLVILEGSTWLKQFGVDYYISY
jgi:hypothetical protein